VILSFATLLPNVSARIFTDQKGNTIEAELISMYQDQVVFRRSLDKKVFTMTLEEFSVKDQNFIHGEKEAGRLSMINYTGPQQASVQPVRKDLRHFNASKQIDQILAKYWKANKVEPAPVIDDSTYLRRAYLKIIGRIPTYAEAVHFLNNDTPNKRQELVDKLLDSPGYVSHNFNLWADVLRARTDGKEGSRYGGVYYVPWLKDQIRQNVPYNEFVRTLITADGYPWDNPAAAYYLRDFGMPLDNMSMTAQIFLGTQLQCAQCHDHPTDVWTQKDFYELSAFTFGLKTGINVPDDVPQLKPIYQDLRRKAKEENNGTVPGRQQASQLSAAIELFYPLRWRVEHSEKPLKLPHDYQYDNAKPDEVVKPKILFGELNKTELHNSSDRVESYADWLVSKNNKRFTMVIANRMWKHAMGKGLIEPIDNMTDDSVADSPELMVYLETLMKALNYDLKQYQRVLYNSDYFQRQAVIDNPDLADDYHLEGPIFQRMTSEQIWDSIATLMTPDIDHILTPVYSASDRGLKYISDQKPAAAQFLEDLSRNQLVAYVDKLTDTYKEYQESRTAINEMRNDPTKRGTLDARKAQQRMKDANEEWRAALNPGAEVTKDGPNMDMMTANIPQNNYSNKKGNKNRSEDKWISSIRRASELSSPSRDGHLLEVFGQSDRMLIENSSDDGNVLQALFLMNSPQTNVLIANRSAPVLEARLAKTPADKLDTLYLGFLARKPTQAEQETLVPYLEAQPEIGQQRIIWAMLNTQQFLFIQ
jgi:hypothetical protein